MQANRSSDQNKIIWMQSSEGRRSTQTQVQTKCESTLTESDIDLNQAALQN